MSKAGGGMNTVTKIIVWVLVVLLLLGAAGALYYLLSRPVSPQGMYIRYGDIVIADSGESIELFSDGGDVATFAIEKSDGWGAYSVVDCTVTVIPYAGENQNFKFSVAGEEMPYSFNSETDFTSAFAGENGSVSVNSDGTFELHFRCKDMLSILETIYGQGQVILSQPADISAYPYFALRIVSASGDEVLVIPFRCAYSVPSVDISGIFLDKDVVYI